MTKKETIKFVVQLIASIASAILTALGATSGVGALRQNKASFIASLSYCYNLKLKMSIRIHKPSRSGGLIREGDYDPL